MGITPEMHTKALLEYGWTIEDWKRGSKTKGKKIIILYYNHYFINLIGWLENVPSVNSFFNKSSLNENNTKQLNNNNNDLPLSSLPSIIDKENQSLKKEEIKNNNHSQSSENNNNNNIK